GMKTMFEEDPSELLGLEEEGGTMELSGLEDDEEGEEDDPRELLGLGEEEGIDDDDSELSGDEEEDPTELLGSGEEDDEEEDDEEEPEYERPGAGLRVAAGLRARRRGRMFAVGAPRRRRSAPKAAVAGLPR